MANTLKFGNGEWYGKKDTILAYNDENNNYKPLPFDFSRASSATRVNKAGLIETVGSGEPRIDYKDSADGALLLENSSTNLITYSIPIDSAPYYYEVGGVALAPIHTANQGISPDGSLNASKIDFNLNGGTTSSDLSQMAYTSSSLTGDYVSSFYLKSFDSNSYIVTLLDPNGATSQETITPEWQRFTFYNGGGTTSTNLIRIRLRGNENTSNTASLLAWGFQFENNSYATSYIPTSGSAVTRLADVCNNGGNEQVINSTEGVLYLHTKPITDDYSNNDVDFSSQINLSDGNLNNGVNIRFRGTALQCLYYNGLGYEAVLTYNNISVSETYKVAFLYKQNDFKMYVNGVLISSDTNGSIGSFTLDRVTFDNSNGANPFYGNVKDIRVYNTALTDQELIALTQV